MRKNTRAYLSVGAFILFMVIAFFIYQSLGKSYDPPSLAPEETAAATDFSVMDSQGERVQLSDFYGKPIIVNLWATWCPYCREEMPMLEEKYKQYGEDIVFLMIDIADGKQETVEIAKAYIEDNGFTFPVYFDTDLEAIYAYNPSGTLPFTFFIDKSGTLSSYQPGKLSKEALDRTIESLLK
ncbi:MAG: TlpA disulfide reductase family protein [Anaerovorax sp.]